MGGVDLNLIGRYSELFRGAAREHRQNAPVPVAVSMGALSLHQGGEDAHAARSARQHPELHPHFRRQVARRSRPRSAAARSGRHLCHGSRLRRFHAPYVLHQAGAFFITRAKSNLDAHRVYSAPTDRATGIIAGQTIALDGYATRKDYPDHLRRVRFKDPETEKALVFLTNQFALCRPPRSAPSTKAAGRSSFSSSGSSSIFGSNNSTARRTTP
jgi:hypothetical protein